MAKVRVVIQSEDGSETLAFFTASDDEAPDQYKLAQDLEELFLDSFGSEDQE